MNNRHSQSWVSFYMVVITLTEYKTEEQKRAFYNSAAWKILRQQALERDNYECQECKRQGYVTLDSEKEEGRRKEIKLNVHHKFEIEHYPKLALWLDNLETLCVYHHNEIHGKNEILEKHQFKKKEIKWDDERW